MAARFNIDGIRTTEEAERAIAQILLNFTGPTAARRLEERARNSRRSREQVAQWTASNLLTSFNVTRY